MTGASCDVAAMTNASWCRRRAASRSPAAPSSGHPALVIATARNCGATVWSPSTVERPSQMYACRREVAVEPGECRRPRSRRRPGPSARADAGRVPHRLRDLEAGAVDVAGEPEHADELGAEGQPVFPGAQLDDARNASSSMARPRSRSRRATPTQPRQRTQRERRAPPLADANGRDRAAVTKSASASAWSRPKFSITCARMRWAVARIQGSGSSTGISAIAASLVVARRSGTSRRSRRSGGTIRRIGIVGMPIACARSRRPRRTTAARGRTRGCRRRSAARRSCTRPPAPRLAGRRGRSELASGSSGARATAALIRSTPSLRWPRSHQYHPSDAAEPDRGVRVAGRCRATQGGVEVVMVGAQPGEPVELVGAEQAGRVRRPRSRGSRRRALARIRSRDRRPRRAGSTPYARIVSSIRYRSSGPSSRTTSSDLSTRSVSTSSTRSRGRSAPAQMLFGRARAWRHPERWRAAATARVRSRRAAPSSSRRPRAASGGAATRSGCRR